MIIGGTYTAWRFDTTKFMAGFRRVASALAVLSGAAFADCPQCTDGLIGNGPVKIVCPWCCGKNESDFPQGVEGKDGSFPDRKPDTSPQDAGISAQLPTIPSVGFQDPVPSKAGALDHLQSVVRIVSRHGNSASGGSGVVIEHDGKPAILTARHVVYEDGQPGKVEVIFRDDSRSPATIVKADKPYDLALLACEKYGAVAVSLAASPKLGESLTVAGFGSHPHTFREATGRVIGRAKPIGRYAADFIDVSAGARQGDSGGPIFNERGEVAGILWGSDGTSSTLGSHSDRLRAFLSNGPKDLDNLSIACPDGRCPKR